MIVFLFGEVIYSLPDFDEVITILCNFSGEFVVLGGVIREVAELESHVCKVLHGGVKVEIPDIDCRDFSLGV